MTREEALKIVRENMHLSYDEGHIFEALKTLVPELEESEDERIRKIIRLALIASEDELSDFYKAHNIHRKECTDWLEKQKEQSITANDLDEEVHRFFDDCIVVHEAKLYGNISERVIPVDCYELTARHFAKWGEQQKEQNPAEWSEEDEAAFGDLMWCIEQARKSAKDENDMGNIWFAENWVKNRLKSLRPQPHWKPSNEQMNALKLVARGFMTDDPSAIDSLLADLQKLL